MGFLFICVSVIVVYICVCLLRCLVIDCIRLPVGAYCLLFACVFSCCVWAVLLLTYLWYVEGSFVCGFVCFVDLLFVNCWCFDVFTGLLFVYLVLCLVV